MRFSAVAVLWASLFSGILAVSRPAAAQTLKATPNPVVFCSSSSLNQTVAVTDLSGGGAVISGLSASITGSSPSPAFATAVAANTNQIAVQRTIAPASGTYTATLHITATGYTALDVSLTFIAGSSSCVPTSGSGTGQVTLDKTAVPMLVESGTTGHSSLTLTNNSSATVNYAASVTTNTAWLTVVPGSGVLAQGASTTLDIAANAAKPRLNNGLYTGSISITVNGSFLANIQVQLTVGLPTAGINVNQTVFTFSYTPGGAKPAGQALQFWLPSTAAITPTYTLQPVVGTAVNWLLVDGQPGLEAGTFQSLTEHVPVGLSVDPTGLTPNTYTGLVQISVSGYPAVIVNVTLVVGGGASGLTVSPNPVILSSSQPATTLVVTGTQSGQPFTVSYTSNCSCLSVSPTTGTTDATIGISANTTNLQNGTYSGTLTFTSTVGTVYVPVSITVGNQTNGSPDYAPGSLEFFYQTGSGHPLYPQFILATGRGTAEVPPGVDAPWLFVTIGAFDGNYQSYAVTVDPTGLDIGSYSADVMIYSSTGITYDVPVTLTVTEAAQTGAILEAVPGGDVVLKYEAGQGLPSRDIQINSSYSGLELPFSIDADPFLVIAANQSTTPAGLHIGLDPAFLTGGLNLGAISITAGGAANSPLVIPVVVQVSGGVTTNPNNLNFSEAAGDRPNTQTIRVTAPSATPFTTTVYTVDGADWLSVTPAEGTTNANLMVTVDPGLMTEGQYQGGVGITANGFTQYVNVAVTVSPGGGNTGALQASPASLSTAWTIGSTAPSPLAIQLHGSGGSVGFNAAASASDGGTWLSVSPQQGVVQGTTPVNLSVVLDPANLTLGTYSGSITISVRGTPDITVPVTFTVMNANTITLSRNNVTFTYEAGAPAPAAQTVRVVSTGTDLEFAAFADSTGWLLAEPVSGTTPANLSISVDPSALNVGTQTGTVTVGAGDTILLINVSITVTAPLPTIAAVTNAASYARGGVSPGEVVTIFGPEVGGDGGLTLDEFGNVATMLANTQVLFNGIPAPLIYTSRTQASAIVPYALAGRTSTIVQVKYLGVASNGLSIPVATTAPGIFTANASGTGPAAALNQDGITPNSPANPAHRGDVIALYVTGEGQTLPAGITGSVTPFDPPYPKPVLPVTALIDGKPCDILYYGEAPGLIAGVMQVNVRIPETAGTGQVSVVVYAGPNISQAGVTVSVE